MPALILSAVFKMWGKSVVDKFAVVIFIIAFALAVLTEISPILIVAVSAVIGIIIKYLKKGEEVK